MKKDKNYLWLILITLCIMIVCMKFGNLYGSTTDWLSQHTVYPDYFRQLFYETGNLFPNLALHIGAGQNIYHFSYYGLLNPIYMISYFFPWVSMVDYIMIVSILSTLCSVLLCYKWLKKHFEKRIAFLGSLFFLCAAPFIFHSHRHLMFVNYIPFLILGLMGVERHFEKRNSNLLIFSIFMMIMTSYYYSVGGICAVSLYALSYYIKNTKKINIKLFLKESISYLFPVVLAILLSSILLLPTMHSILQSRTELNNVVSLIELLIPRINMDALFYSSYSLGLTSISLISILFCLLDKRKDTRFLAITSCFLLFVPLFVYLLNGTLYYRSKVLIPFLPLFLFQITFFFEQLEQKKNSLIPLFCLLFLFFFVLLLSGYHEIRFLVDFIITVLSLLLFLLFKKKWLFYLPILSIAFSVVISNNLGENYVSKEDYHHIFSSNSSLLIKDILNQDTTNWYRMVYNEDVSYTMNQIFDMRYYSETLYSSTYHNGYKNFFDKEFKNPLPIRNILDQVSTSNGLFHMYMGAKYYVSKDMPPVGYDKVGQIGELSIYQNKDVLPIGYVSSRISSLQEYQETPYPYNLENLYQTIVVDHNIDSSFEHQIQEVTLDYLVPETELKVEKNENGFLIQAEKTTSFKVDLKEEWNQKYLLIQFDLKQIPSCKTGDISIAINGQKNKLTCKEWMYFNQNTSFEYVISSNYPISSLDIEFSKGVFDIQNIKTYALDYNLVAKRKNEVDEFVVNQDQTKGDFISGTIEVKEDGYFLLNVPYDKGFEVKVNGKKVKTEVVNTTFLGFPLEQGTYQIDITYHAPYQKEGKMLSSISLILWGIYFFSHRKKHQNEIK